MKKIALFVWGLLFAFVLNAQTYNVKFELTVPEGVPSQGRNIFISGALPPVSNWDKPGTNPSLQMSLKPGTTDVYTITLQLNPGQIQFKFFQATTSAPDWDAGEWPGDPNRVATVTGNMKITAIWGDQNSTQSTSLKVIPNSSFIYPSLVKDFVNVNEIGNVEIVDLCGKVVKTANTSVNSTIDMSALPQGIYMIKLENKDGVRIQKIYKQ